MTAIQLLAYILLALLLQVLAGLGFAVWRRPATADSPLSASVDEGVSAVIGAWPGWRDFRVLRREFEDAAQTQCSFHLQPVDGAPLAHSSLASTSRSC
jgi:hypothetical protein